MPEYDLMSEINDENRLLYRLLLLSAIDDGDSERVKLKVEWSRGGIAEEDEDLI